MRYMYIPAPIRMTDPFTDEPGDLWGFSKTATALCLAILQSRSLDVMDVIDLRTKLRRPAGELIEIGESEYSALEAETKRPQLILTPVAQLSLGPHFRAILSATDRRPDVQLVANGPTQPLASFVNG